MKREFLYCNYCGNKFKPEPGKSAHICANCALNNRREAQRINTIRFIVHVLDRRKKDE